MKPKMFLMIMGGLFTLFVVYLFFGSLEPPDHIHSRDDVPQQQQSQSTDLASTISMLEMQLQQNPNDDALLMQLGHAYMENQQYAEGEEIFRKVSELNPQNPESRVDLGICLRQTGEVEQALQMLQKATTDFPQYGDGWLQLAVLYRDNLQENKRALEYFQKYLQVEPQSNLAPQVRQEVERIKRQLD